MAVRRLRDKTRWAQGGNGLCVCLDVRVGFDLANRLYKPIKWDLVDVLLGHLVEQRQRHLLILSERVG